MFSFSTIALIALCIYHEARGESLEGQKLIAHVILNRSYNREQSIHEVIYDKWQFSWTMDDIDDYPTNIPVYFKCMNVVADVLKEREQGYTFHKADLYYNPDQATPDWDWSKVQFIAKVGKHKVYKEIR